MIPYLHLELLVIDYEECNAVKLVVQVARNQHSVHVVHVYFNRDVLVDVDPGTEEAVRHLYGHRGETVLDY